MGRREARRWHDWVIVLGIVALGVTGVWTLWGGEIRRVIRPDEPATIPAEAATTIEPQAPPTGPPSPSRTTPAPVSPPPGQAAGPF